MTITSEARRHARYFDSEGIPSVGIGFNLERADAIEKLRKLGADWRGIMAGTSELTDAQMDKLFQWCWDEAIAYVKTLFPNWGSIMPEAQMVLADMSFQMRARLVGFVKMRAAIARLDYPEMINQMRQSKYARQCASRVNRNAAVIEAGILAAKNRGEPVC